jgi:glycogen operon protein
MVFLNGDAIPEPGPRGQRVVDDSFLVLFNAHHEVMEFTLPEAEYGASWEVVIDTGRRTEDGAKVAAMESMRAVSRSTIVLRRA